MNVSSPKFSGKVSPVRTGHSAARTLPDFTGELFPTKTPKRIMIELKLSAEDCTYHYNSVTDIEFTCGYIDIYTVKDENESYYHKVENFDTIKILGLDIE